MLVLHGYFRSSAAHRVRIALNLKGLDYKQKFYRLRHGEQRAPDYLAINPQGLVPTLEHDGLVITQSLAILEYLDETFLQPSFLPPDRAGRARVRSLANICAVDTHPLSKGKVLQYLEAELGLDENARQQWCRRWFADCFGPIESRLAAEPETGQLCHGNQPTIADICLVPQVLTAKRFGFDLSPFPTVSRLYEMATSLKAFREAMPDQQPDAE
ncbi:maleylacetoacetate isomerase [Paraburkholderia sediminicola]|uniref:maleylacetoacetate isomerase n=1 Tax=Paraburkholderia sediminicola TaxID=458836 RepID=UPI0038B73D58